MGPLLKDFDSNEGIKAGHQFSKASKDFGFVTINNHGIDKHLILKGNHHQF